MTIFDMQSFPHAGALIQARRKELSLSQENVADRIGISAKALSKIETGKNSLSSEHIQPLSDLLIIPSHILLAYIEPSLTYGQEPYYYDGQKYSITCDLTEETIRETIHQIKSEYFHEFLENPRRTFAWYKTQRDFVIESLRFAMDKDGRILFRYYFSPEEFNLLCEIHKIHRIDVSDGFNRRLVRQLADILDKDPRIDNAALEPRDRPNYKDRELFLRVEYLGGHENVSDTVFSPIRERILSELRPDEEKWKEKLREEKEVWEQYISQTTT